jgi:RNA polymerase sigma-70 factor (ECF subfamily)
MYPLEGATPEAADAQAAAAAAAAEDRRLVQGLRAGDEAVYTELVRGWHPAMVRVARMYVRDRSVAEEVVQETWLAVLGGIDRFEGRSSLKTWVFRILTNRAKTRGVREARSVPFSALGGDAEAQAGEPAVPAERFLSPDNPRTPSAWATPPRSWASIPEERLEARETLDCIRMAIADLPDAQRAVIALRDIDGWSAAEVRDALEITDANQRVLLHRARSKVRMACETELEAA